MLSPGKKTDKEKKKTHSGKILRTELSIVKDQYIVPGVRIPTIEDVPDPAERFNNIQALRKRYILTPALIDETPPALVSSCSEIVDQESNVEEIISSSSESVTDVGPRNYLAEVQLPDDMLDPIDFIHQASGGEDFLQMTQSEGLASPLIKRPRPKNYLASFDRSHSIRNKQNNRNISNKLISDISHIELDESLTSSVDSEEVFKQIKNEALSFDKNIIPSDSRSKPNDNSYSYEYNLSQETPFNMSSSSDEIKSQKESFDYDEVLQRLKNERNKIMENISYADTENLSSIQPPAAMQYCDTSDSFQSSDKVEMPNIGATNRLARLLNNTIASCVSQPSLHSAFESINNTTDALRKQMKKEVIKQKYLASTPKNSKMHKHLSARLSDKFDMIDDIHLDLDELTNSQYSNLSSTFSQKHNENEMIDDISSINLENTSTVNDFSKRNAYSHSSTPNARRSLQASHNMLDDVSSIVFDDTTRSRSSAGKRSIRSHTSDPRNMHIIKKRLFTTSHGLIDDISDINLENTSTVNSFETAGKRSVNSQTSTPYVKRSSQANMLDDVSTIMFDDTRSRSSANKRSIHSHTSDPKNKHELIDDISGIDFDVLQESDAKKDELTSCISNKSGHYRRTPSRHKMISDISEISLENSTKSRHLTDDKLNLKHSFIDSVNTNQTHPNNTDGLIDDISEMTYFDSATSQSHETTNKSTPRNEHKVHKRSLSKSRGMIDDISEMTSFDSTTTRSHPNNTDRMIDDISEMAYFDSATSQSHETTNKSTPRNEHKVHKRSLSKSRGMIDDISDINLNSRTRSEVFTNSRITSQRSNNSRTPNTPVAHGHMHFTSDHGFMDDISAISFVDSDSSIENILTKSKLIDELSDISLVDSSFNISSNSKKVTFKSNDTIISSELNKNEEIIENVPGSSLVNSSLPLSKSRTTSQTLHIESKPNKENTLVIKTPKCYNLKLDVQYEMPENVEAEEESDIEKIYGMIDDISEISLIDSSLARDIATNKSVHLSNNVVPSTSKPSNIKSRIPSKIPSRIPSRVPNMPQKTSSPKPGKKFTDKVLNLINPTEKRKKQIYNQPSSSRAPQQIPSTMKSTASQTIAEPENIPGQIKSRLPRRISKIPSKIISIKKK